MTNSSKDLLTFSEKKQASNSAYSGKYWQALIVDDDEAVHLLTKMVLKDYSFQNKPLRLLHAYSKAEALEVLAKEQDIALILLDVVMETNAAGLECVKEIRENLNNQKVRIVLRTGQPGEAPEREVIENYDINDYKAKTELTSQKLYTTVTTSLRAYEYIMIIEQNRKGLENIIKATSGLFGWQSFRLFAKGILQQMTAILQLDEHSLFITSSGVAAFQDDLNDGYNILAGTGNFAGKEDKDIEEILSKNDYSILSRAIEEKRSIFEGNTFAGFFESSKGEHSLLFSNWQRNLTEMEQDLLSIYSSNIAIAFENISLEKEIVETQKEIIFTLSEVVEERSKETGNHISRVAGISELLARKLGMGEQLVELIRLAAPMHDVGKVGVPDSILLKPGKLTDEEFENMKQHTTIGYQILKNSKRELMLTAAEIAYQHHEKWNGKGYPRGIKGEEISILGRIVALADVFDALLSKRCYKEAFETDKALEIIAKERGEHFDPDLVDIFMGSVDEFLKILKKYSD